MRRLSILLVSSAMHESCLILEQMLPNIDPGRQASAPACPQKQLLIAPPPPFSKTAGIRIARKAGRT